MIICVRLPTVALKIGLDAYKLMTFTEMLDAASSPDKYGIVRNKSL